MFCFQCQEAAKDTGCTIKGVCSKFGVDVMALLHLGVKNIYLGSTLPAFVSPNVLKILVDTFGFSGISGVEEDIALMLG